MAKQNSLLKIEGTIGGMTFYRSQDGMMVKEKGGVSKSKIATDPAFQRTRENGKEFGNAGTSGKMLRDAVRSLMLSASDSRVTSRLTKIMSQILKEDKASVRGDRNVAAGLKTPEGKALLKHFNFNINAILGSILFRPYILEAATGQITVNDVTPINDIIAPAGATHATIRCAFAAIEFATGRANVEFSETINLALNGVKTNIQLVPDEVPTLNTETTSLYFLQMEFFQEVNSVQYSLKNGAYNCLELIEVL